MQSISGHAGQHSLVLTSNCVPVTPPYLDYSYDLACDFCRPCLIGTLLSSDTGVQGPTPKQTSLQGQLSVPGVYGRDVNSRNRRLSRSELKRKLHATSMLWLAKSSQQGCVASPQGSCALGCVTGRESTVMTI